MQLLTLNEIHDHAININYHKAIEIIQFDFEFLIWTMPWYCMKRKNAELIALPRQKEIDVKLFHFELQLFRWHCSWKTTESKSILFAPPSRVVEKEITHRNCFISNNKLQRIRNLFDFILCCFLLCSVLFIFFPAFFDVVVEECQTRNCVIFISV